MARQTARKNMHFVAKLLVGAAGVSMTFAAAPVAADVKAGVDAWSVGDYSAAVEQWRGPAGQGDADALFNLAQAYRLGRGVDADVDRARQLYAEAARKGHVKAADNYGLLLFQQGEQSEAMPLITAAAKRGDPRAQYVLGLSHFNGDYAEKDWVRAYALMTLSVAAGLPQAQNAVAQMDQYIPIEQRQDAQVLARVLESDASKLRSEQLATAELQRGSSNSPRIPVEASQPTPTARPVETNFSLNAPGSAASAPPAATPAPVRAAPARTSSDGPWRAQLGAFGVASNADRLWAKLSRTSALAGTHKVLVPAGRVTRLQAGGFVSRSAAEQACSALKAKGQGCLVTRK